MKILGIESTCDETAAAIVEDGRKLISNVVHSQIDIHSAYGGVIPEVAARSHLEYINPVVNQALDEANLTWDDIDAISVSYAPGLVGSLLVGNLSASTLALIKDKPLYPVHHVEAHVYANFIVEQEDSDALFEGDVARRASRAPRDGEATRRAAPESKVLNLPHRQPAFPMLALIVSGGHSQLVLFEDHGDFTLLGQTQDDAVGEAFDKVAKILGLPYPGGPSIAKAALDGDSNAHKLPKAKLQGEFDFSFSGLKTAVLRAVQREVGVGLDFPSQELAGRLDDATRANFAASFQRTAVETLVDTTKRAFDVYSPKSVVIAGGVAANQELRRILSDRLPINIEYAPMNLCTDNAAMIATLGYYKAQKTAPTSPYDAEVVPSLSMSKTSWA